MDFDDCMEYLDIIVLREMGTLLNKDGSALLRKEEDGPPKSQYPHILCILEEKVILNMCCNNILIHLYQHT